MPPRTAPVTYAISLLRFPIFSWVLHNKARRRGANEALATAYPFDHRSSSTTGIVNRLGIVNGIDRINNNLEQETHIHCGNLLGRCGTSLSALDSSSEAYTESSSSLPSENILPLTGSNGVTASSLNFRACFLKSSLAATTNA
ncbi:hypothetical protein G4B88_024138 [Cannabis sativa]|uniref:Uncharacterized protein n=1 Tax=Cannabis sativa TaxID=3483 RepID=A0A7J6H3Q3_CANSA|nr:hypothetical protein G4B88_024138 [Cannabis sativa]